MAREASLFNLIHSLEPAEKRHFKVHAAKNLNGGNKFNYEKLFDAINEWSNESYTEKDFKRKHKGKTFIKNLSVEKTQLRDLILKVMRSYHAGKVPEITFHEMYLDIKFLFDKGLKEEAKALLEKARELVEKEEMLPELLLLNDLLYENYPTGAASTPYKLEVMGKQEVEILNRLNLSRRVVYLRQRIFEIDAQEKWHDCKDEVDGIITETEKLLQCDPLSRKCARKLLNIQQLFFIRQRKFEESFAITQKWVSGLVSKIEISSEARTIIANYLLSALRCGRMEVFPFAISLLKRIRPASQKEAAELFRLTTQYELIWMLNSHDFREADEKLNEIKKGLTQYSEMITKRQIIYFRLNLVLLYFFQGKYDHALNEMRDIDILAGRDSKYIPVLLEIRVLEWLSQYALKNFEVLDFQLRNLKRYYKEYSTSNEFTEAIFKLFKDITTTPNQKPKQLQEWISEFRLAEPAPAQQQMKGVILDYFAV